MSLLSETPSDMDLMAVTSESMSENSQVQSINIALN